MDRPEFLFVAYQEFLSVRCAGERGWSQMVRELYVAAITMLLSTVLLAGCGQSATPGEIRTSESTGLLNVTVSILPQKYFVERVGGEHVNVNVMVQPGANPATYEPRPEQLTALSEADAYFSIGVPFENAWLNRIASANGEMLMVDTTAGIARMPMEAHHHPGEAEENKGEVYPEDEPENPDPHVWLSPTLVKTQAQTIYAALVALDPAHEDAYEATLDRLTLTHWTLTSARHWRRWRAKGSWSFIRRGATSPATMGWR
jgi:zinc transport system substrate-binding protein